MRISLARKIASVLIVEDSVVQRDHAVKLCSALGVATVHAAGDGAEALALLEGLALPPELVILDLEMPTLDGAQTLELMQQGGHDIPVLMVSSREVSLIELVGDMGSILGLRIIGAVQKPLALEILRVILDKDLPKPRGQRAGEERTKPVSNVTAEDLAAAIGRGDLEVHYQPKVHLRTAMIRGVEALVRWNHPTQGAVPPDCFIPLAEQSGLIRAVTMRVINESLRQCATWMAQGLHLSMAINLSPVLLDDSNLPPEILALQKTYGVPPDKITFELTESSLVSGRGVALGVLARLRLKGFGLSIDDYGTGFSSMQQLTRIPFTELKIDRSFVRNAHERGSRRVILRSALDMADQLGVTSVAEGVETLAEWRLLQELGCAVVQGYFIARPMPGESLMEWLKAYRGRMAELRGTADLRVVGSTGSAWAG
jgi:EAL domain-containing protein (putative c-di-GMP-specific phosphodiesterase class I)/CheY-like chemotaxis protein